jgi:hypothetical protein
MVWVSDLDLTGPDHGSVTGLLEHGSEPSGSIKGGQFLD